MMGGGGGYEVVSMEVTELGRGGGKSFINTLWCYLCEKA